jgi:hypothetical protein
MKLVGLANVALSLLDFVLSVLIGRVNAGFLALELTTLLIGILLVSLARRQ